MIELPYRAAFDRSLKLCRSYGFSWFICIAFTISFCFFICPQQRKIEEKNALIELKNQEISQHEIMIKRQEKSIELIEEREPKTMERLVREAFDVKGENETGIHSPPFNIAK